MEEQARDEEIQAESLEEELQRNDPKSLVGLSIRAGLSREEKAQKVAEAAAHMKFSEKDVLDALEGSRGEVAKLVCFPHVIYCDWFLLYGSSGLKTLDVIFRVHVCSITPVSWSTLGVTCYGWPPLHGTGATWS